MTETARMYGGSLYDLAAEEGLETRILGELDEAVALFKASPEYLHLLSTPSIPKKERCGLLDEALRDRVHLYVLNFLKILCEKGTLRELPGCARAYRVRYNQAHGILEAVATTAVAMTEQQVKSLHEKLEKLTGKTIDLKTKVDPAVLGGIRLDIEGTELDGTVHALGIGNGDDGVVKRALDMSSASSNILALFLFGAGITSRTSFRSSHFSSSLLLLVSNSALRTFAGTGIGLGALAAARQALAMTYTTEALDFGQTLNVQRDVPAEIALNDDIVFVNVVTDLSFIVSRQILDAGIRVDSGAGENLVSSALTDTINISQTNLDPLLARQINTSNTCHKAPPLVTSHVLVGACAGNLRTWPPSVLGTVSRVLTPDL